MRSACQQCRLLGGGSRDVVGRAGRASGQAPGQMHRKTQSITRLQKHHHYHHHHQGRRTAKEPQRTLQPPSDVRQWLVRIRRRSRLHGKVLSITGERSGRHHPTHEARGCSKGRSSPSPCRPRLGPACSTLSFMAAS